LIASYNPIGAISLIGEIEGKLKEEGVAGSLSSFNLQFFLRGITPFS
jgi:hypothetical protein